MTKTISVSQARSNFSELLSQVYYQGQQFLLQKMGRPMAVLIRLEDLLELSNQAERTREKRFRKLFAIAEKNKDIPFSQVKEDVEQAIAETRSK